MTQHLDVPWPGWQRTLHQNILTCIAGAAGEALEAELNKAGPGSCKFVTCDISKEEDIKVKVQLWCDYTGQMFTLPLHVTRPVANAVSCLSHDFNPETQASSWNKCFVLSVTYQTAAWAGITAPTSSMCSLQLFCLTTGFPCAALQSNVNGVVCVCVCVCPQRLIAVTVEHYGQIDCLVNNAGWRE